MLKIVKSTDNGYYYFNGLENIGHSYVLEKEFIRIYTNNELYYLYFNGNIEKITTDMERYYKDCEDGFIGKCTETRVLYYDIDTFIEDHNEETITIDIITETAKLLNINLKRAD